MKELVHKHPFTLENGTVLDELRIGYHTYGTINADASNVVWICHALTASSDVAAWWPGVAGENELINPQDHFIVCANIIGSCYGSTGPLSTDPVTHQPHYNNFPLITIRDMVNAHIILRNALNIQKIRLLVGGSMGGYQALEWCIMEKDVIEKLFLLVTSPTESAWGIAIHAAQRMAIEADHTWNLPQDDAGINGLKAARAIGILSYRNYASFSHKQADTDSEKTSDYKAASYIQYQGNKLASRFNAFSYRTLTMAMDTHHIARKRGGDVNAVLRSIQQPALIIGISSDILCPVQEQKHMAAEMPHADYVEIDSIYGHDGFLVEDKKIVVILRNWLADK